MNEMTEDWDDLRLFLAVAREGGLAAAASSTGKSPATLGRRMLALERRLGRELFRRLARGYDLTEEGQSLLTEVAALESRIRPLVQSDLARALPVVKVSAGTWVTQVLCARASELVGSDQLRLRFLAAEKQLDIARRETLIGIRNARPEALGLAGRKVARISFAVYAAHPGIVTWARVLADTPSARWVKDTAGAAGDIEVTSPRSALDLALAGLARVVLPTFVGGRLDRLQQVSPQIKELEHDQWLVTHHEDRFRPEVRKVVDRIFQVLRETSASA